jgi:hypothetical protein
LGRGSTKIAPAHVREKVPEVESQDIDDFGFSNLGSYKPVYSESFPAVVDPCA